MPLFSDNDLAFVEAVAALPYCNPFVPERVELERRALGSDFRELGPVWHFDVDLDRNPNHDRIRQQLETLLPKAREGILRDDASAADRRRVRDLALYLLYDRFQERFFRLLSGTTPSARRRVTFYEEFETEARELLGDPRLALPEVAAPELLFAWFFQIRRAFHFIFRTIAGASSPAARLRAAVWKSVFTHDVERYRAGLYRVMGDITTLITGPSGTGKELVARAIGLSRFIPFAPSRQEFVEDFEGAFYALNLTALSPTLIESELFGHRRGSFTGALDDRPGWFEVCPRLGAVFLDEIGDVEPSVQVKLLRVLQSRTFQRLGDTRDLRFEGKLIAATNRDPETLLASGAMREDLYYRLCSDRIVTPALRDQLAESPDELPRLVLAATARLFGREMADELSRDAVSWIENELGPTYPWPGNFRELEQCVRNVVVRGNYRPAGASSGALGGFVDDVRAGSLSHEQLLAYYATLVYARTGSYSAAARRLAIDRRTVKAKIDADFLAELQGDGGR